MKVTHSLGFVLFGIGAVSCAVAFAQTQETKPLTVVTQENELVPNWFGPDNLRFHSLNFHQESRKLAQLYVKAEKEEDKKNIRKKLADVLAKQFDAQVERQQKDLADLEKQIASLKALLKKRTDAKTTIIDRRMEQLIQDAEGLGWAVPGNYGFPGNQAANPYTRPFPIEEKKP
jgi:flagellar motility protein MotE (MotC chaperone)